MANKLVKLSTQYDSHEEVCTQRWEEATKVWDEARADMKTVLAFQENIKGQMLGAVGTGRFLHALGGIIAGFITALVAFKTLFH